VIIFPILHGSNFFMNQICKCITALEDSLIWGFNLECVHILNLYFQACLKWVFECFYTTETGLLYPFVLLEILFLSPNALDSFLSDFRFVKRLCCFIPLNRWYCSNETVCTPGKKRIMVFYATFNNMSAISVLLVEESEVPGIRTHNFSSDRHWLHS